MSVKKSESIVLVVNDVSDQLAMIRLLLQRSGYRVLTASDGREGFEIARQNHPDLIISDVMMPYLDGIEMCRLTRQQPDLHLTPILLVSAIRKDSKSVVEGLSAGADDYLEVPFEPLHLVTKVARLMRSARL